MQSNNYYEQASEQKHHVIQNQIAQYSSITFKHAQNLFSVLLQFCCVECS